MAIEFPQQRSRLDIWRKRFLEPSASLIQPLSLLDYNSEYFSIICNLQKPGTDPREVTQINHHGNRETYLAEERITPLHWLCPFLHTFVMFERRPWIAVNGDTDMMARLKFTGEDLKAIRGKELAVYFYEPLFQRSKLNVRCPAFYDDETPEIYFPELMWLEDFNRNHGGNLKIVAYVCDYGLKEYLSKKNLYPGIRVETIDLFLANTAYQMQMWSVKDPGPQYTVSKKFICPNFRYEGVRELIVGFLEGMDLTEHGHISFFHKHIEQNFRSSLPFDPKKLSHWEEIQLGLQRMQAKLPFVMDTVSSQLLSQQNDHLPDGDGVSNLRQDLFLRNHTGEAYVSIINESRYGVRCGEVSEKVLQAILARRPFIVIGAPYMLKYLRELGFETFGDYWNESYDEILDHGQRMEAILHLLEKQLRPSLETLQAKLIRMSGVTNRNYNHLIRNLPTRLQKSIWLESERATR